MPELNFTFLIERDEEQGYTARCLELKGVYGQGETEEEALEDIKNALDLALEFYKEKNIQIPYRKFIQVKLFVETATTSS